MNGLSMKRGPLGGSSEKLEDAVGSDVHPAQAQNPPLDFVEAFDWLAAGVGAGAPLENIENVDPLSEFLGVEFEDE